MDLTIPQITTFINTYSIYPAFLAFIFLIRYYQISKLKQYLIFSITFAFAFASFFFIGPNYSISEADNSKILMMYRINMQFIIAFVTWYIIASMKWKRIPRKWIYPQLIYGGILFVLTFFLELHPLQSQSSYLIFNARPFEGYFLEIGTMVWGVVTPNGTVLYYAGFPTNSFYRIIINISIAYLYFTLDHVSPSKKSYFAKYVWSLHYLMYIIVSITLLFYEILFIEISLDFFLVTVFFVGLGNVIEPLILIFFPEVVVLNHHQFAKVQDLYKKIQSKTPEPHSKIDIGYKFMKSYLQSIPAHILEEARSNEV